jgi:hypothetical protein
MLNLNLLLTNVIAAAANKQGKGKATKGGKAAPAPTAKNEKKETKETKNQTNTKDINSDQDSNEGIDDVNSDEGSDNNSLKNNAAYYKVMTAFFQLQQLTKDFFKFDSNSVGQISSANVIQAMLHGIKLTIKQENIPNNKDDRLAHILDSITAFVAEECYKHWKKEDDSSKDTHISPFYQPGGMSEILKTIGKKFLDTHGKLKSEYQDGYNKFPSLFILSLKQNQNNGQESSKNTMWFLSPIISSYDAHWLKESEINAYFVRIIAQETLNIAIRSNNMSIINSEEMHRKQDEVIKIGENVSLLVPKNNTQIGQEKYAYLLSVKYLFDLFKKEIKNLSFDGLPSAVSVEELKNMICNQYLSFLMDNFKYLFIHN